MKKQTFKSKYTQTGSAIIVCLMLLTIATLIAINAVSSTVLEEKMAGNIRNKHMSFQGAEAGLRAGEVAAAALSDVTLFDGSNGLFPGSNPGDTKGLAGALASYPVWDNITDGEWVDGTDIGLSDIPQYVIENFSESPRDRDCQYERPRPAGCMLPVYRITARSVGLNSNTVTVIQSTYKRL
jgi:type IV pilus assembly protein PilX